MVELKPIKCPFCGEEVTTQIRSGSVCFVKCNSCKAEGPLVDIEEIRDIDSLTLENWMDTVNKMRLKAVEKWNKRASSPEKTDTEKAYDNLSFSFKALATAAGKLAEENEKMKKAIQVMKSCGSCKHIFVSEDKLPCRLCPTENDLYSKWEYNEE